jgi:aspartyl-tRNA(Asn)/glutamyl-tRNA(Gln) amidotransferase subunit A
LRRGEISALELTRAVLNRINALDGLLHAYLTITGESALDQARDADAKLAAWRQTPNRPLPPLIGVPMAVKDNICTRGVRTTAGSKILENFVPPFDATVIERLRAAGAIMVGKTNPDEFAMGSSGENSAYGPSRNPWDTTRVPGGSSAGSAAAVAVDETIFALGTDTGGSVRQPAGLTNTVGLRPTYGRVSRYGLVAFGSSLDQCGPITKDVRDAALILETMAGHDPRDATTVEDEVPDYFAVLVGALGAFVGAFDKTPLREGAFCQTPLQGMRVGVPREYFGEGLQPGVEHAIREALKVFESLGAVLEEVRLPHTDYALPAYYLIAPAEASANLARYDGVKYGFRAEVEGDVWDVMRATRGRGFGAEVKRRIMLGTYALSAGYYDAYYLKAQKVRTLIKKDFDDAFERVDVVVGPTSPTTAFKIGEKIEDPLQMYLADVFTLSQALAGIPTISIPCGFADGLPVGLQIMGRAFDEARILRVACAYEGATEWHKKKAM